jgi:cellulose synthase operon protein C
MRPPHPRPGLPTLALALALTGAWAGRVCAAEAAAGSAVTTTISAAADSGSHTIVTTMPDSASHAIPTTGDTLAAGPYHLRRAVEALARGDDGAAVRELEAIELGDAPTFAGADRAAFLLAQAYRRMGDRARLAALTRQVAGWPPSLYTRWIADRAAVDAATRGDSIASPPSAADPMAVALAASLWLEQGGPARALALVRDAAARRPGDALLASVEAAALAANGQDDEPALEDVIASADSTTALGRELLGSAWLARATRAIARGEDPRELLARVPAGTRAEPRARHLQALASIEHGDRAGGGALLADRAVTTPGDPERREAMLALAGLAMDDGRWAAAESLYSVIERDRVAERDTLKQLADHGSCATLWEWWRQGGAAAFLPLDAAPYDTAARQLADASLDLAARPVAPPPAPTPANPAGPLSWSVPPPPPEAWNALSGVTDTRDANTAELTRTRWAIEHERAGLAERRAYLTFGIARTRTEAAELLQHQAWLDSLRARAKVLEARLAAVRDSAARRVAERTGAVLRQASGDSLWISAMRWYHLDGPHRQRPVAPPAGYPGPDTTLASEDSLTAAVATLARHLAEAAPALLARSYSDDWRPSLIGRLTTLGDAAGRALAWAHHLDHELDSTLAANATSDTLKTLLRLETRLASRGDSLDRAVAQVRERTARTAVDRALAGLEDEREAIDYGLAASTYALAVKLERTTDSTAAESTAAASPDPGETPDDPATAAWRATAITRMQDFLTAHPNSDARGEMRFQLADLMIVDARQRFREAMNRHMADGATGPLPVLDVGPALALYRAILAEDPSFPHRDAVLFDAGMILADQADPGAEPMFTELVEKHPDSPYVPQAWLRLGDIRFAAQRWDESSEMYAHAAESPDPEMRAIAWFKRGWSEYDQDRWSDAAQAFREVLDVYASPARTRLRADIEKEAESYLVESLSRSGDATSAAAFFDGTGARVYEQRVLLTLAQHERRYSHFEQAAAIDRLVLDRFPTSPEALTSAQSLIATEERAHRTDAANAARADLAARFVPDGAWARAQRSDSVRAAGEAFAHASWLAVASQQHLGARKSHDPAAWRAALDVYRNLLTRWPNDADNPSLELRAGEAALALGEYQDALAHDRVAANSGAPDSVITRAMWQRVAALDAWYESSRSASHDTSATKLGSPDLAHGVLAAADSLTQRFPADTGAAGLAWRTGQLAWAHGWDERASADFSRLASTWPANAHAPDAAGLAADALFHAGRYADAGPAYERALVVARAAHREPLARRLEQAIPVSEFKAAEAVVARDSSRAADYAPMFEQLADRWPSFADADLARYRAGLAWLKAGETARGVHDLETLIHEHPDGRYTRDARLQIATAWEKAGDKEHAAAAYLAYSDAYPKSHDAGDAQLKAADLTEAAGHPDKAEALRFDYIRRHPEDEVAAMEILEKAARRELAATDATHPTSALLVTPATKVHKAAPAQTRLAEYLQHAAKRPDLASLSLVAEVRFRLAVETDSAARLVVLRQPLMKSLAARQKLLDSTLVRYRRCIETGDAGWGHAAAYRMGDALVAFGTALENSQPPADLKGDDLRAYRMVLRRKSAVFGERAEEVWSDLLRRQTGHKDDDRWTAAAKDALWHRLGGRFTFRPETVYPLVEATEPASSADTTRPDGATGPAASRHGSREGDTP